MTDDRPDHLDHNAETGDLTGGAPVDGAFAQPAAPASAVPMPKTIGKYRILRIIGEGGMGTVYEAEQESPRRTVALKVIRAGLANARLLRRFEYEGEILGRLDHSGIATIFEAGTFDAGLGPQPYFAMEYVDGTPLTEYATDNNLGTRQRLELVARIAEAIQHAHQKGVIHRDLKPANILVTDDRQIKILDFGVARATDSDLQSVTMQTDIGQLVGTLPYMSPEQAVADPDDLDTRSDVYSLGVVAYELLCGAMPYDLSRRVIHEAVRVIREHSPAPLSSVDRLLRGDVEIMIGKALEKEKDRRYQNANDLAQDIRRYLGGEPIVARPPSTVYQLHRFISRNKALVTSMAAILIVSVIGTVVSISFAVGEAEQKRAAQESAEVARDAQTLAEERAVEAQLAHAIAESINDFLNVRLLGAAAPDREGRDVLVRDMLTQAAEELDTNPPELERVEAALRLTIGRTFTGLGHSTEGTAHLRKAVEMWKALEGSDSLEAAEAMEGLAFSVMDRGEFEEAAALAHQVLSIRKQHLGIDHALTVRAQGDVVMFDALQRGEIAGGLNDMALDLIRNAQRKGESREQLRQRLNGLILELETLVAAGRMEQATAMLHQEVSPFLAIKMIQARVPYALASYAVMLGERGLLRAAEAMSLYAVQISEQHLTPDHPYALHSLYSAGEVYWQQGRRQESMEYLTRYVDGKRRSLGDNNNDTLHNIYMLGRRFQAMGSLADAEASYRESLRGFRDTLGDEHASTLTSVYTLGKVLLMQGRLDEAETYLREDLETTRRVRGTTDEETIMSIYNLSQLYQEMHRFADAERLAVEFHDIYLTLNAERQARVPDPRRFLADLYDAWNQFAPETEHAADAERWRSVAAKIDRLSAPDEASD